MKAFSLSVSKHVESAIFEECHPEIENGEVEVELANNKGLPLQWQRIESAERYLMVTRFESCLARECRLNPLRGGLRLMSDMRSLLLLAVSAFAVVQACPEVVVTWKDDDGAQSFIVQLGGTNSALANSVLSLGPKGVAKHSNVGVTAALDSPETFNLQVTTDKTTVGPGETVVVTTRPTDENGYRILLMSGNSLDQIVSYENEAGDVPFEMEDCPWIPSRGCWNIGVPFSGPSMHQELHAGQRLAAIKLSNSSVSSDLHSGASQFSTAASLDASDISVYVVDATTGTRTPAKVLRILSQNPRTHETSFEIQMPEGATLGTFGETVFLSVSQNIYSQTGKFIGRAEGQSQDLTLVYTHLGVMTFGLIMGAILRGKKTVINNKGDNAVIGGRDVSQEDVSMSSNRSRSGVSGAELNSLFDRLSLQVEQAIPKLQPTEAAKLAVNHERLKKATKSKSKTAKNEIRLSAKGMIEAAQAVAGMAPSIKETLDVITDVYMNL